MAKRSVSFSKILEGIYTKQDAQTYLSALEEAAEDLYKVRSNVEKKLRDVLPTDLTENIIRFFREQGISLKSKKDFDWFLEGLKGQVNSLPVITLYVASNVSEKFLQETSDSLSKTLGRQVLLDIEIDKTLVAGAGIGINGMYKEYSVRSRLEEYLGKNKLSSFIKQETS